MVEEDLDEETKRILKEVEDSEEEKRSEKDLVDKSIEEIKVDLVEEVEPDSNEVGTDNYKDYEKMSDKEKVKYGF